MKYIDSDKLIAEINKRLMAVNLEVLRNMGSHRVWAYNDVKSIIDQMKQEEPTPSGIEEEGQQYADIAPQLEEMSRLQCYQLGTMHGSNALIKQIWHKESEHPDNRHPYPVLNPDGEMAFAYYDELCGWQFDREFKHSANMLWLDIEKIIPKED